MTEGGGGGGHKALFIKISLAENSEECVDRESLEVHVLNQPWVTGDCAQDTCIRFSDHDVRILHER